MKAIDLIINENVYTVSVESDCRQAARIMMEYEVGCLPVLDPQGRLEGIITDRDIAIRLVAMGRSFETPVREIMSKPVTTIHPQADAREVEHLMERHKVRRLPIVDEAGKLVGIISVSDMVHRYRGFLREHRLAEVLEGVSTP